MKRLSQEQISEIINLYQNGQTPTEIGQQFNIFPGSVVRIMRKRNLPRTQHSPQVSEEQIKEIIKNYTAGISSEKIAKKLNIEGTTVCHILKKNNIAIRSATENKRRYKINPAYFQQVDTAEKAYFLGLIYSDGNLSKKGSGIKIILRAYDKDILEKLSQLIYGKIKLETHWRDYKGEMIDFTHFLISSQQMHADLIKLGAIPNKTFTIRFPTEEIVPKEFLWHFIRGYFDGDGSICILNEEYHKSVINFTSNALFIQGLIEFLEGQGIKCSKMQLNQENPLTGSVNVSSVPAEIIKTYKLMYENATLYLERKYNKFQEVLQSFEIKKSKKEEKISNLKYYGTTYIATYQNQPLTNNKLKSMSSEEKENAVEEIFEFYRDNGFPYSQYSDDQLLKDFNKLQQLNISTIEKDHILTQYQPAGLNIFKHFAHHFYQVKSGREDKKSMMEVFLDDKLLKKVIKNRLDQNYNITGNMIKQGLVGSKIAYKASIYTPAVAKFIYSKCTQPNDLVFDYSMGFGQRLLGAMSINHPLTYVGVDPMIETVETNQEIYQFLQSNIPMFQGKSDLICSGSENYYDPKYDNKFSLAFSCPPYFNLEKYDDNDNQAYAGGYCQFINQWWRQTVKNISQMLKTDGILAFNIKEEVDEFEMGRDMTNICREQGYQLIDTYYLQSNRNTVFQGADGKNKFEPIYLMKRI